MKSELLEKGIEFIYAKQIIAINYTSVAKISLESKQKGW